MIDLNECDASHDCNLNANCINNIGNYTCECHSGFTGNGYGLDGCVGK